MKKMWIAPRMELNAAEANEVVAACYEIKCQWWTLMGGFWAGAFSGATLKDETGNTVVKYDDLDLNKLDHINGWNTDNDVVFHTSNKNDLGVGVFERGNTKTDVYYWGDGNHVANKDSLVTGQEANWS